MLHPNTQSIVFDGTGAKSINIALLLDGSYRAAMLYVEPARANSNPAYVGVAGMAIGTSLLTDVIRELAAPASGQPLDHFLIDVSNKLNLIDSTVYLFDGTSGESVKITGWEC